MTYDYQNLKHAASQINRVEEICPGCCGKGIASGSNDLTAKGFCSQCCGKGRVWCLPHGALGVQETDNDLWAHYQKYLNAKTT